ncbi:MAG: carboxypeptidase-like regulatory domain-containing protein [Tannerellaceae bacterium]|nr:carboxypeptidase-like regulatory domain-containing protein [Tannerellaceae bacterium]
MKRMRFCLLPLLLAPGVNAQTINGIVVNGERLPIESATIVMQTPDSIYVNATTTDSLGAFNMASDVTSYRLIVQHLAYETYENSYTGRQEIMIQLTEKDNQLEDIVVKGERPVVKLVDGRITYDMPRLLQGKVVGNTYESLLQLPGVREQNGSLILAGSTGVTLLVNGKMTSMPVANLIAALKMLPYDQVQSAEIMYSTPPQYHIRGAAINIILKGGGSTDGVSGQVNTAYTQKTTSTSTPLTSTTEPFTRSGSLTGETARRTNTTSAWRWTTSYRTKTGSASPIPRKSLPE